MHLKSEIKKFLNSDLLDFLIQGYHKIPAIYKKTFWTVFIVLNIVFAFHTVSFFWSNHEWPLMAGHISPTHFWYEARFTQTMPYVLFGSRILPVMMNIFGFFGLALSSVALAIYWKIPKKVSFYIAFSLMTALMPYNLIWLYHTAQTSYFWGVFIIVCALELFDKKSDSHYLILWSIPISFMLFWTMGMNASFIMTIFILAIGRYSIDFVNGEKVFTLFKKASLLFLNIIIATAILKLCVILAQHYHILLSGFYNTQHIALSDIFSKFFRIIPYMWKQFTITYPFFDDCFLSFLLCISALGFITFFWQSIKKRGFVLGFWVVFFMTIALLMASQLTTLIAKQEGIEFWFRITGYFGLYYIFALMIAFLCHFFTKNMLKNILFLIATVLITFNIQRDMYAIKVWYQGREAETKLMDRVMAHIEMSEGFQYDKKYAILLLGDFSLRMKYYQEHYDMYDMSILNWSFRAPWETMTYFNYYAPSNFIHTNYRDYWNFEFTKKLFPRLSTDTFNFILNKASVWPDKNSVFIKDNTIFVILDKGLLNSLKRQINLYLEKIPPEK